MSVVGGDAKAPELLGVVVLLDCPERGTAESRAFMGELTRDQRKRAAAELLRIAEGFSDEDS
jgi:hypothetical protein